MFETGELVMLGASGVCEVLGTTHMDMPEVDKDRLYYVMKPKYSSGSKVYTPVDSKKTVIRKILTRRQAKALVEKIPEIETLWIENEKQRELCYKEAIRKYDCEEWVKIIKTLYQRKQDRMVRGKKITSVDEKYWHIAEDYLYGELAAALEIDRAEVEAYIEDALKEKV